MMPACQTPRWCVSLAGLLAATCFPALAQKTPDASGHGNSAKYAGAEVCQGCHEDQYKSFAQSAHLQTLKKEKALEQGCEGCHGPGAAHAEAGDPDKIRRFADARPDSIQAVCTTCHKINLGEQHTKARLTCLTCHSPHHYQQRKAMLVAEKTQLCQRCHHGPPPGPSHL
jgi:predicted CXXCH cytochrome family protein